MTRRRSPSAQQLSQVGHRELGDHEHVREEHEEPPQQVLRAQGWRSNTCQESRSPGLVALLTKRERILCVEGSDSVKEL